MPVDWCPSGGHHQWLRLPETGTFVDRVHKVDMRSSAHDGVANDYQVVTIAAHAAEWHADGGINMSVGVAISIGDDVTAEWHSREAVETIVGAIRRAADLAFGPVPPTGDTDEFDAATTELVERAANPTDVNRLVAAAIRRGHVFGTGDVELHVNEVTPWARGGRATRTGLRRRVQARLRSAP